METLVKEKKITRATFKSFINKNKDRLYFNASSSFDGMVDCVMPIKQAPHKATFCDKDYLYEHNLGINGIWLVGHSRDWFKEYEDELFKGIEVSNCCGSFTIGILK